VRSERTDASFRAIALIILAALALGAVIFAGVLAFFKDYRHSLDDVRKSPYPLARTPSTELPRPPRLEQIDRRAGVETPNVYERQANAEEILNSYGPTREKDFVHIPIERAIELLENKRLGRAEVPAEQAKKAGGLLDAGESNSGRMFRKGAR